MTDAKEAILSRIQRAMQSSIPPETIERSYRQSGSVDLQLFEERLVDYGVTLYRCSLADIRETIRTALAHAGKKHVLIPPGFTTDILPDGLVFQRDDALPFEELDQAEGVLTGCALAVAETGSIFLRHSPEEGRRALTLLPDYHLCIVHAGQVVATVPEGIRLAAQWGRFPITTISGPSATSDIEMTRVKGVHGPRTLDVVLVS